MQPVVPVYDIGGHFASGKATTLGNQSNPLGYAWSHKDDRNTNGRIFGNVFGGLDLTHRLTAKTRFGFNVGQGSVRTFTPTPGPRCTRISSWPSGGASSRS